MAGKEEILRNDREYVLHGWGIIPKILVKGDRATVTDIDGKEYIEMWAQTAGVISIGHRHPHWIKSVKEQLEKISHTLTPFINEPRATLAARIAKIAPGKLRNNCMMYFSAGGSEANEANLKAAMILKQKTEVIGTYFSYHGATLSLMSLLGQGYFRPKILPRFPGFSVIPNAYCYRCYYGQEYPGCSLECAWALKDHIKYNCNKDNAVAFILELIPGNGGHQTPPKEYFKVIREICNEQDVLLIVDEVQTGMGRTGEYWACDYFGVSPDIMTVGKALGGGMPLSASVIRKDLISQELIEKQWHIVTFGGAPISCAAGNAVLDVIEEEHLLSHVKKVAPVLRKRLDEMAEKRRLVGNVDGVGLFLGVELVKDKKTKEPAIEEAAKVFAKGLEKGILIPTNATGGYGNILKIKPVLNITEEEVHKACDILDEVLTEVEA
jgi:4-aminobutyrate aminotransferase-like enzyme